MKLKIGVIFGGRSCEHDVSIISGLQAAQALDRNSYEPTIIYISREGDWFVGEALSDVKFFKSFDRSRVTKVVPSGFGGKLRLLTIEPKSGFLARLAGGDAEEAHVLHELDVVMPVMHGVNGEDGTLQGLLEMFDVPYTSAGVMGSAVGMDKITMKQLFLGCGFPVVPGTWFSRARWSKERAKVLDEVEAQLSYPVFVKPANLGSSIGISRADDRLSLEEAIDTASAYDRRILVEKGVEELREVNCAVLGYGSEVRSSALEMPLSSGEFLDFQDKYLRGGKGKNGMQALARRIPAPIGDEMTAKIKALAEDIFRAMDLKGCVRIDFILDKDDNLYVNEANVIPGSLAFYLWEPEGVSFAELLEKMIEYALKASADRRHSVFSYDSAILSRIVSGTKGGKLGK